MSPRAVRTLAALLLALALALPGAIPVLAVEDAPAGEEAEPAPTSLEQVAQDNEVVQEFLPEEFVQPSVFPPILYALLGVGLLITIALLALFLLWQPRFAQERAARAKGKGRR